MTDRIVLESPLLPDTLTGDRRARPARSGSERQYGAWGRWTKRSLIVISVVAAIASAASLIPRAISPSEAGPQLTHTIMPGDLLVSVVEKGTVESAHNIEIKCKVRGAHIPIIWIVDSGTEVETGDVLVRLETLEFEDRVAEVSKWAHMTRAAAERSHADVARAELAISEYLEGRYRSQLMTLEKDLAIAESNLRTARNMLDHARMMAQRGYVSELEIDERTFAVTQAELYVNVKKTEIDVLQNFAKAMELETLNGNLKTTQAKHDADTERAKQLAEQLVLCEGDLANCVVKAEKSGTVIYPTAEPWKWMPEIEVGATVYMGQTMLLMPDLSQMQVKVSMPEAVVHRVKPGMEAHVRLQDKTLEGQVDSVASVAAPTSRWTGNIVTYDTIIKLSSASGLKPGESAVVEVIIARHHDVLTIPVAAVVQTAAGDFCWVKSADGVDRRALELGDSNDVFTVVKSGVKQGEEVLLEPSALEQQNKPAL